MSLDQANNSNLMLKIAGGLIVILGLVATYIWLSTDQKVAKTPSSAVAMTTTSAKNQAQSNRPPDITAAVNTESSAQVDAGALVQNSILNDTIPAQPSLAKEEIAKLDDLQNQLATQQKMLEAQQADADQLIQLKEQQIKILEQQLLAQK